MSVFFISWPVSGSVYIKKYVWSKHIMLSGMLTLMYSVGYLAKASAL